MEKDGEQNEVDSLLNLILKGNYLYGEETKAAREIEKRINSRRYDFLTERLIRVRFQNILIEKIEEQINHGRPNLHFIGNALEIIAEVGDKKAIEKLDAINVGHHYSKNYLEEYLQIAKEGIKKRFISSP